MKTALLINGGKAYTESKGRLSASLQAVANACVVDGRALDSEKIH